ncbi:MAG: GlsB/YeaQ/YmgE family stress response membrane protein [Mycobacterium sp.]
MLWTILSAVIAGLIIGALARLILPGKQNIGLIMTIALGVVGALIGAWISFELFNYDDVSIWRPVPFVIGLVVAIILVAIYVALTGRRGTKTPTTPTPPPAP